MRDAKILRKWCIFRIFFFTAWPEQLLTGVSSVSGGAGFSKEEGSKENFIRLLKRANVTEGFVKDA